MSRRDTSNIYLMRHAQKVYRGCSGHREGSLKPVPRTLAELTMTSEQVTVPPGHGKQVKKINKKSHALLGLDITRNKCP